MKKTYIKPVMLVVKLQHQSHLMQVSGGKFSPRSYEIVTFEEFEMESEGFEEDDDLR